MPVSLTTSHLRILNFYLLQGLSNDVTSSCILSAYARAQRDSRNWLVFELIFTWFFWSLMKCFSWICYSILKESVSLDHRSRLRQLQIGKESGKATNAIASNLKSRVLKYSQVWGVDKFLLTVIWLTTIWIASFVPDVQYKRKIRKWARAPSISDDKFVIITKPKPVSVNELLWFYLRIAFRVLNIYIVSVNLCRLC